jgi:hypothetical protein
LSNRLRHFGRLQIPSEVRQLQNVELVNMSNNRLGCVPRIFNLMYTITDLSVDNNGVECIEPGAH